MESKTVIGQRSVQIKKFGNLEADFELYDVQRNKTENLRGKTVPIYVGAPVIMGMVPRAIWKNGENVNHFYKFSCT